MISYIVQSVPSRRAVRKRLVRELPDPIVVEDKGPLPGNPWRGYQLCLKAIPEQATHAVIIQDDAIVCQNFTASVKRLSKVLPDNPICLFYPGLPLYSTKRRRRQYRDAGKTLFPLMRRDLLPVVAVLWPKDKAEHLLEWTSANKLPGLRPPYRSDDAVGGVWMRMTKQDVYVTIPSLVQHPDDTDPVKGGHHEARHGRDRGRIALEYCEGDSLEIEWRF